MARCELFWPICPKALQHFLIALDAYNNFRGSSIRNGNVNGIFYAIYFDQFARRNVSFLLGRLNILRVFWMQSCVPWNGNFAKEATGFTLLFEYFSANEN